MTWKSLTPVTISLILASIGMSIWADFGSNLEVLRRFTIVEFQKVNDLVRYGELDTLRASGEWWRLLTPMFLHFSSSHLLFNGLWLWLLGRPVEKLAGSVHLLLVFIAMVLVGNLAQFYFTGPLFGGLSGGVFGLMAYGLTLQGNRRYAGLRLAPGLWVFAVVYIGLGFTPVLQMMGMGQMANEAHIAGFVAGIVFGLLHRMVLFLRR